MLLNVICPLLTILSTSMGLPTLAEEVAPKFNFPPTSDKRQVLAVDLHTHTVFSDGLVWPNLRAQEALREGLTAYATTEHLESKPRVADSDRNRSYQIASEYARNKGLLVFNGAEITRTMPPGHVNAVFIEDANALLVDNYVYHGAKNPATPAAMTGARKAIQAANEQGAFLFWNHPFYPATNSPDAVARLSPMHKTLFGDGLIQGIEVANGNDYSEEGFAIALQYNLTMLGNSDVHGLIDWNEWHIYRGESAKHKVPENHHRTVTLVLTRPTTGDADKTDAIKAALRERATVVYFGDMLLGRTKELDALIGGALSIRASEEPTSQVYANIAGIRIDNESPVNIQLRNLSQYGFLNQTDVVTIPARGSRHLIVKGLTNLANLSSLKVEVLNALVAPKKNLIIDLVH